MNPQAFPSSHQNLLNGLPSEEMKGMDLRDYFAAKAMKEMAWTEDNIDVCAIGAYRIADAMMKARND